VDPHDAPVSVPDAEGAADAAPADASGDAAPVDARVALDAAAADGRIEPPDSSMVGDDAGPADAAPFDADPAPDASSADAALADAAPADAAPADAVPADAAPADAALPCDLTGRWIAEQHTTHRILGIEQRTTAWLYFDIRQSGDAFTIERELHCGYTSTGLTTVHLPDATLEAVARHEHAGPGRRGTFAPTPDGRCRFTLDRMVDVRGADKQAYLLASWRVGDPARPLGDFAPLPQAPPGMEDWDGDGFQGITQQTAIGARYIAQRAWHEHTGIVDRDASRFGGPGAVIVTWDSQETVSDQTSPLLRVVGTPDGDGWARYARADELRVIETGEHPELETCRNVQSMARQTWPVAARR
jgi:hypothetical protein